MRSQACKYLEDSLHLQVNTVKSQLTSLYSGISYLGFQITKIGVLLSKKSLEKFKDKVRKLTPRSRGESIDYHIKELNQLLRGFANYFKIGLVRKQFRDLMYWIRRRLRMMMMKGWKSWKPLHKQLRRMGYKGRFKKISVTRWRNSSCTLAHMALPNSWFEEKRLFNLEKVPTNTLHQYFEQVLNKV